MTLEDIKKYLEMPYSSYSYEDEHTENFQFTLRVETSVLMLIQYLKEQERNE